MTKTQLEEMIVELEGVVESLMVERDELEAGAIVTGPVFGRTVFPIKTLEQVMAEGDMVKETVTGLDSAGNAVYPGGIKVSPL